MKRIFLLAAGLLVATSGLLAETREKVAFGDFEHWVTRTIKESAIIGGKSKTLYEIGPTQTIHGNKAYRNLGGSPWATSNVYAKVAGVVKGSNAVFPAQRAAGNKCVKLSTIMEKVKALGVVNMDVLVSGSIYFGTMVEPVSSTKNPYSKLDMNVRFTKRPKYLTYDYKVEIPANAQMIYSSGFGKKKVLKSRMHARYSCCCSADGRMPTATSTQSAWEQVANATRKAPDGSTDTACASTTETSSDSLTIKAT